MKSLLVKNSTKALVVIPSKHLIATKKVASKMIIISSKSLLATFLLTFVNLFV